MSKNDDTTYSQGNFRAHPCLLFPHKDGHFQTIQKPIAPLINNPYPNAHITSATFNIFLLYKLLSTNIYFLIFYLHINCYCRQDLVRKGSSGKDEKSNIFSTWIAENLERLKVPIFSPTIFKPLVLISALNCLQQCSGSLYIRKFIIQILDNNSDQEYSDTSNMTTAASDDCGDDCDTEDGGDSLNYFLPLIIFSVRLLVLFMMAFLIKKIRMRFLYFLSLFLTVTILSILGIVSDSSLMPDLGGNSVKYIKTCLLCLHVFFIQFGVQTLPGSAANRLIGEFVQSQRRPLLGPSPG